MASNIAAPSKLTHREQLRMLEAVGIRPGQIFTLEILDTPRWAIQVNQQGEMQIIEGPVDRRGALCGLLTVWMLESYAASHGITGLSVGFSQSELNQVSAFAKFLPGDITPQNLKRRCGKFWADFRRDLPKRSA
jgi:hypothetical protein